MRQSCRDCGNYCIHCGFCRADREYHEMGDGCRDFTPEDGEENEEIDNDNWENVYQND